MYLDSLAKNGETAFASPVWSDRAHRNLADLGERLAGALLTAIRKRTLLATPEPDWRQGAYAIEDVLRTPAAFLRAKPIWWGTTFTELQFTTGLAHFLNAGAQALRTARVRAFLKAIGVATGEGLHDVVAKAEAGIEARRRIDLLIHWKDGAGCHAAAVEAKIGHYVTEGQLEAYRNHLGHVDCRRRHLVVVSPRHTTSIADSLRQNPEWRWISWRALLKAHEKGLCAIFDDEAYLQFRSTLWDQVA